MLTKVSGTGLGGRSRPSTRERMRKAVADSTVSQQIKNSLAFGVEIVYDTDIYNGLIKC